MHTPATRSNRSCTRFAGFALFAWLPTLALPWPALAGEQRAYTERPLQTATLAGGGSSPGSADVPSRDVIIAEIDGRQWALDSVHSGAAGIASIEVLPVRGSTLQAGTPLSQALASSGDFGANMPPLQTGVVPPLGLTRTSRGMLGGTPTQRSAYEFGVRATDAITPAAQFVDQGDAGAIQSPKVSPANGSLLPARNVALRADVHPDINGSVSPHA